MSGDRSRAAQRQISELSLDAAPYIVNEEEDPRLSGQTVGHDMAAAGGRRIMHPSLSDSRLRSHNETVQPSGISQASSQLVVSSRRHDDDYSDVSKNEPSADFDRMQQLIDKYSHLMPPEIKVGYYDVMILYSKEDQEAAEMYRDHLQNDIMLDKDHRVKAVLYDDEELRSLSESMLKGLDEGFKRCTFAFVYLTKSFCECEWCSLSSEGCLIDSIYNKDKKWCVVPVYTVQRSKADFRIPMGLNSLKGVNYYNNDDFYRRGLKRLIGDRLHIRLRKEEKHILEQYKFACDERNRELARQQLYKASQEEESQKHKAFEQYLEQKKQKEQQQVGQHHQYLPSGYHEYPDSLNSEKQGQFVSGSKSMVTKLPSENIDFQLDKQQIMLKQQNSHPSQSERSQPTESSSVSYNPQAGLSRHKNPVESSHGFAKDESSRSKSLPHPEKEALKQAIQNFERLNVFPAQGCKGKSRMTSREPTESLEEIIPQNEDERLHETDEGISYISSGSDHHLTEGLEDGSLQSDRLHSRNLEQDYVSGLTTSTVNQNQNQTRQPLNPESVYEKPKAFHDEDIKQKVIIHEHHHFYNQPSQTPVVKNYNIVGAHNVIVGEGGTIISGSTTGNGDVEEEEKGDSSTENSSILQKPECHPTRTGHSSSISSSVREDGGSKLETSVCESNIPEKQTSAASEQFKLRYGQNQVHLPSGINDSKQKSDQSHEKPVAVAKVMPMPSPNNSTVSQKSQVQYSSNSNVTNRKTAVSLPQKTVTPSSSSSSYEKDTVVKGENSNTVSEETLVKFTSHPLAVDNEQTELKKLISLDSGRNETDSNLNIPNKNTAYERKNQTSCESREIEGDSSLGQYTFVEKDLEIDMCTCDEELLASGTDVDSGSDLTKSDLEVQAVQKVLEMGFPSVKVKEALNILRSRRKGHTHFSVTQILDIVEGSDSEIEVLERTTSMSESVSIDETAGNHQGAVTRHSKSSPDLASLNRSFQAKKNCSIS